MERQKKIPQDLLIRMEEKVPETGLYSGGINFITDTVKTMIPSIKMEVIGKRMNKGNLLEIGQKNSKYMFDENPEKIDCKK